MFSTLTPDAFSIGSAILVVVIVIVYFLIMSKRGK